MPTESDLMKQFFESSDAILYLKDEEGRFLMVSRAFGEVFQVDTREILGKTDYDIASAEQADKWRALDARVRETGTPMQSRETVAIPGGEMTSIAHKFPVSGIEGSPHAVGGVAIRITDLE